MFALNFISEHNEKLLLSRQKSATIRPGDLRDVYPENSIVWVTVGKRYGQKKRLFTAIIDRVLTKKYRDLTTKELEHQNPEIKNVEELIKIFEDIYEKQIHIDDTVTVIHFSEIEE
ncbi:hypothetical protein SRRS_08200 [Sporomusa rhizae]|uniref:ASCH domain-containing protein n=1 Tax=Sporomusa rhizae TaxID=357999 RepID=UPI00352AE7CE